MLGMQHDVPKPGDLLETHPLGGASFPAHVWADYDNVLRHGLDTGDSPVDAHALVLVLVPPGHDVTGPRAVLVVAPGPVVGWMLLVELRRVGARRG